MMPDEFSAPQSNRLQSDRLQSDRLHSDAPQSKMMPHPTPYTTQNAR